MEPISFVSEADEAELKVMTINLYKHGGAENVLACVSTMQKCQIIILKKLNEILKDEISELERENDK